MIAPAFIKPDLSTRLTFVDGLLDTANEVQVAEYQMTISEYIKRNKVFLAKRASGRIVEGTFITLFSNTALLPLS